MGSPEKLTRQQYKEEHSIKDLPDLIEGTLVDKVEIPDTPFYRIRLNNGFSILVPENGFELFKKGDELSICKDQKKTFIRGINTLQGNKLTEGPTVDETQVIPNEHWEEEALSLIERSKNNPESWKEHSRWERYRKSKKPKPYQEDPDWLERLKRDTSSGVLFSKETDPEI